MPLRDAADSSFESFDWYLDDNGTVDATISMEALPINIDNANQRAFREVNVIGKDNTTANLEFVSRSGSLAIRTSSIVGAANTGFLNSIEVFNGQSVYGDPSARGPNSGITIGFRFNRGSDVHFGLADLSFENLIPEEDSLSEPATPSPFRFTLDNVRWNDVAGADIPADAIAVPEPASAVTGLGLLALGAAGLCSFRRKTRSA